MSIPRRTGDPMAAAPMAMRRVRTGEHRPTSEGSAVTTPASPDPSRIMQLGLGFWGSKTLLSAVEIGLFTELAAGGENGDSLSARLGLHPRSARDFLDSLLALGMLRREGNVYSNTPECDLFL